MDCFKCNAKLVVNGFLCKECLDELHKLRAAQYIEEIKKISESIVISKCAESISEIADWFERKTGQVVSSVDFRFVEVQEFSEKYAKSILAKVQIS